jgi:hypothetical protein
MSSFAFMVPVHGFVYILKCRELDLEEVALISDRILRIFRYSPVASTFPKSLTIYRQTSTNNSTTLTPPILQMNFEYKKINS